MAIDRGWWWGNDSARREPGTLEVLITSEVLFVIHSTNTVMLFPEPGSVQAAGYREMNETLSSLLDISQSSQEAEMETQSQDRSDK